MLLGDDPLEEMCKKLGKQAKDAGIGVSNYAVAADFLNKNLDEEVERIKGELRNGCCSARVPCATMRRGSCRRTAPSAPSVRALPRIAEGCRRVTEYAETLGIRTMTENHGTFVQESARVEALIEAVDHPNFGALVDMGNFMCADEAPGSCGRDGAAGLPCPCQGFPLQALHGAQSRQGLVRHARRRVPAWHGDRPRRGAGGSLPRILKMRATMEPSPMSSRVWNPARRPLHFPARISQR